MKKMGAIFLLFLYLNVSAGTGIHLHFCMQKMVSWSWQSDRTPACPSCGMAKSQQADTGCCRDEVKSLQVDGNHLGSAAQQLPSVNCLILHPALLSVGEEPLLLPAVSAWSAMVPPDSGPPSFYLQYRVFLI